MKKTTSVTEIPIAEGGEYDDRYPGDAGFNYRVFQKSMFGSGAETYNELRPPCLNKISTILPNGSKLILALYATPTMPGYCRYFGQQVILKNDKGQAPAGLSIFGYLPNWLAHLTSVLFLHQDMGFLHFQQQKLFASSGYVFGKFHESLKTTTDSKAYFDTVHIPNKHDVAIYEFRQWLANKAGGGPVWGGKNNNMPAVKGATMLSALSKPLPPAELFNAYEQHTKDCTMCLTALRNLKIIRTVSLLGIGLITLQATWARAVKPLHFLAATVLAGVSFISNAIVKLYYIYEFHHQDNN